MSVVATNTGSNIQHIIRLARSQSRLLRWHFRLVHSHNPAIVLPWWHSCFTHPRMVEMVVACLSRLTALHRATRGLISLTPEREVTEASPKAQSCIVKKTTTLTLKDFAFVTCRLQVSCCRGHSQGRTGDPRRHPEHHEVF